MIAPDGAAAAGATAAANESLLIVGEIRGLYGIKGWLKIHSFTDPLDNIVDFPDWLICKKRSTQWQTVKVQAGRAHGKGVVVKLQGIEDRDSAASLLGASIAIPRGELPALPQGKYYWTDLIGMTVVTSEGVELGRVESLFATGANDVLVVQGERERLIPFVQPEVIRVIDVVGKRMEVAWDPDF